MSMDAASFSSVGRSFHLPWNQAERYWIFIKASEGIIPPVLDELLSALGMQRLADGFLCEAPRAWGGIWERLRHAIASCSADHTVQAAVIGGESQPEVSQFHANCMAVDKVHAIAAHLWLGESLAAGRVMCYLQPVVSSQGGIFGYEAFARAKRENGELMSGGAIVYAGTQLGIEYALDRYFQIEAIKSFVAAGCTGILFINFLPGFIQRPEVYLEGLSQTVHQYGIAPKHIVLDFTRSGEGHDLSHLKRVCDYCRSQGYAIALDDIYSINATKNLIPIIRPDYVKLDMRLSQHAEQQAAMIAGIISHCHNQGVLVIAEGVETENSFEVLKKLKADLYQGYFFHPPLPLDKIKEINELPQ